MISNFLAAVTGFIIHVISTLGYAGVGFLMAIQTVAIPMPSEIIIPFAGFLVSTGRFNLYLVAFVGALGSVFGSMLAYYIGYKGGRPLVEKYGKWVLISENDLVMTEKFFSRFGTWAGFLAMLLPVVRSFVSFPAGMTKVPLKKYVAFVFCGSFIWCLLLGFLGMKLGQNWSSLHEKFKGLEWAVVALIVVGAVWWVWRHIASLKTG